MADLNELSQFEKDLKALIESRGGFQPLSEAPIRSQRMPTCSASKTLMMVSEHGRPFETMTWMAVREHGQPYSTDMAVRHHGQPYAIASTNIAARMWDSRPFAQTKMKSREHGQPYRKWTDEEKEARIQEKLDQVSGYSKYNNLDDEISKLKETVDRLEHATKKDHFDY